MLIYSKESLITSVAIVQVEARSVVGDRRPRNSYHRVYCVFVARTASACHWSWTAVAVCGSCVSFLRGAEITLFW